LGQVARDASSIGLEPGKSVDNAAVLAHIGETQNVSPAILNQVVNTDVFEVYPTSMSQVN
jgi:hypothetical protein